MQHLPSLYTTVEQIPTKPAVNRNPLPDMSVFSSKRSHSTIDSPQLMPPAKLAKMGPGPYSPPLSHECTPNCRYCSTLTNLDIAAFYWSMLAMRGYPQIKAKASTYFDSSMSPPQTPLSPSFDLYSKPPSPTGSFDSDSGPLSPTSSTASDESSVSKDVAVKYQCHVCHKTYSHPRLLNRHMQSHTAYKKHHCPRCRKGFNDAFDLKRHIRTHTGIKPFHCALCDKSFTQRCSLEAHMTRVHSVKQSFAFRERRPKLFVCEDCGETFVDNQKYRLHEKEGCTKRFQK